MPLRTPVFKTGALANSANSPQFVISFEVGNSFAQSGNILPHIAQSEIAASTQEATDFTRTMAMVNMQNSLCRGLVAYCTPSALCPHQIAVLFGIKAVRVLAVGSSTLTPLAFDFENFIVLCLVIVLRLKVTASLTGRVTTHSAFR